MSPLMSCPVLRHQPMLLPARYLRVSNRTGLRNIFRAALLFLLTAGGANSWAQTWISTVCATTTARVTWTTAVPADSQVEYGTTASYDSVTALAGAKVATHSVALSGLTGGTTYHFRVRSSDASGAVVVGPDYSLLISIPLTVSLSPLTSSSSSTAPATVRVMPSANAVVAVLTLSHVILTGGDVTKTVTVVLSITAPPQVQHTVSLSWHAPTAGKVISYSVYRSGLKGGSYGLLASATGGTTYVDQGPQTGTPHYYVVTAVDSQGRESTYSNEIKAAIL